MNRLMTRLVPYRDTYYADHRAPIRVTEPCPIPPGCPEGATSWVSAGSGRPVYGIGCHVPDRHAIDYHVRDLKHPLGDPGEVHRIRGESRLVWVMDGGLRPADGGGWEWWADWVVLRAPRPVREVTP